MSETQPKHPPAKDIRSILRGRADATMMRGAGIVLAASAIVAMGGALGMWLGDGPAQDGNNATPAGPPMASADASWQPAIEFSPPAVESPLPAWRRFAVAVPPTGRTQPMIAVVIDDMGMAQERSLRAVGLPAPLTLAYLPYAEDLAAQTEVARRAGHELIVHIPMEPESADKDTGPNALLTGLDADELRRRLDWNLGRFGAYVGVSNHMGSRFTRDAASMELLLAGLAERGLLFLDSRTASGSFGWRLGRRRGVPVAKRDVFLDNVVEAEAIRARLAELEAMARERGYAVGIGHPHDVTIDVFAEWLPAVAGRGFALVPISAIVAHRERIALAARDGAGGE